MIKLCVEDGENHYSVETYSVDGKNVLFSCGNTVFSIELPQLEPCIDNNGDHVWGLWEDTPISSAEEPTELFPQFHSVNLWSVKEKPTQNRHCTVCHLQQKRTI